MKPYQYLLKHSQELSGKYPGKYIAIVNDEVTSVSDSGIEAFNKAREKDPKKEIHISYIPTEEELVTLL